MVVASETFCSPLFASPIHNNYLVDHLQGAWDLIRKTIWWMTSRDVELR